MQRLCVCVCVLPAWPCPQHSQQLYRHIYLSCKEESNVQQHYEALYGLLALISIELANEEVVVDLIRLVLAVQVGCTGTWGSGRGVCRGGLLWPNTAGRTKLQLLCICLGSLGTLHSWLAIPPGRPQTVGFWNFA